ncbi:gamma-aminobutyric acid type B receptor subunit 2-like, partial [Littorina saxatilis]
MEPNTTVLKLETTTQVKWKGKRKPRDGYQRMHTIRFLPLTSMVLISVLSAIGFLVTCGFIGFNIRFANLQCIKLSSPNMNNVVSVGCGIGYISVIMFGIDGRQLASEAVGIMCHARLFVLCVAYSLAFGALFFKTWRVHRIMANKRLEKITLKDRHLLAWIFGLVGLDVVFLAIWASVDPLQRQLAFLPLEVDSADSDVILVPFIEKCTCEHEVYWLGAMLVYKGLLLLFGLFLAWGTRSIQVPALNDSKYIGMSVYNLAVICVVGVPVGFLINDEYFVGNYIISSVFIIVAVTITLCFVFVPKLHTVYHNPSGEVDLRFGTNPTTTNPFSMSG